MLSVFFHKRSVRKRESQHLGTHGWIKIENGLKMQPQKQKEPITTSTTSTCSPYQNTNKWLIRGDSSNPNHHHHRSPTSILNNPTPKAN